MEYDESRINDALIKEMKKDPDFKNCKNTMTRRYTKGFPVNIESEECIKSRASTPSSSPPLTPRNNNNNNKPKGPYNQATLEYFKKIGIDPFSHEKKP